MGEMLEASKSFIVWTFEFLFLGAVLWFVSPGLAMAILVFILAGGLIFGVIGFIIGFITS